jgi:hypothetical protein
VPLLAGRSVGRTAQAGLQPEIPRRVGMHSIFYIIGVVVVVLAILSFLEFG